LPPLPDGYVCHARELHGDSAVPRFPHDVDNVFIGRGSSWALSSVEAARHRSRSFSAT
jgi:hypothetical protein